MINKIRTLILALSSVVMLAIPATALAADNAHIHGSLCSGADLTISATNTENCATNGQNDPNAKIRSIINWISAVIGVVAVIMIIFGGFRYITSGGNQEAVSSAKKTIMYALIGLVIVALSQLIVKFVLQNVQ